MLTIFPKFAHMEKLNRSVLLVLLLHTATVSAVDISSLVFFDLNGSTQEAINPSFSVRPVSYTHLTLPTNREV